MGRPSKYPQEFQAAAVELVRSSGRPIAEVARELGINEGTLGNWLARERRRRGEQPPDQVSETERSSWYGCGGRMHSCGWRRRS